jgi:hypothetical protein
MNELSSSSPTCDGSFSEKRAQSLHVLYCDDPFPEMRPRPGRVEAERLGRIRPSIVQDPERARFFSELQKAGVGVEGLNELLTLDAKSGRRAMPILLHYLPRLLDASARDAVVRALTDSWARPGAARPLVAEFRASRNEGTMVRWTIGNALSVVATDDVLEDLVAILLERRYGKDREMFAVALARMNDRDRAVSALLEAAEDEQLLGHVLWALRLINDPRARELFESNVDNPIPWQRNEARRGLEKLRRSSG